MKQSYLPFDGLSNILTPEGFEDCMRAWKQAVKERQNQEKKSPYRINIYKDGKQEKELIGLCYHRARKKEFALFEKLCDYMSYLKCRTIIEEEAIREG